MKHLARIFLFMSIASFLLMLESGLSLVISDDGVPRIEWSENGVLINDTLGKSAQKSPRVVSDGLGNFIVVWMDERSGFIDIFAQKISPSGKPFWDENGISICSETKNQSSPQIVADGGGGAIVVWEDYRGDAADIYAQKINSDGSLSWSVKGVAVCSAKAAQLAPKIATDGKGGAIITWYDYRSGRGEDVFAQMLDKNGTAKWEKDGVPVSLKEGTQWYPEIISDSLFGAIIVWTDFRSGKGSDIYGQRIDPEGKMLWQANGLPICFAQENQAYPKLTGDGGGGVIVVWDDFRDFNFDIYAQKIDKDGAPRWKLNGIPVANTEQNEERPEITWTSQGGAVISWILRRGDNSDIYSQKVDGNGNILWGTLGVPACQSSGDQEDHKIITALDGGTIIVWEDARGGPKNIYAQKITEGGHSLWGLDGTALSLGPDDCELPDIAEGLGGHSMVVWQDRRDGNLDIYAQLIEQKGSVGWNEEGVVVNSSIGSVTQQNPRIAYTGDEHHVIVWEDGREGFADIYAQRIDNTGKLVWDPAGLPVAREPGIQRNPNIVRAMEGQVMIAWEDNRTRKKWDIYAQKISSSGTLLWGRGGALLSRSPGSKSKPKLVSDGLGGAIAVWQEDRGALRYDIFCQRIDPNGRILWGEEGRPVCQSSSDQIDPVISFGSDGAIIAWIDYRTGLFNSDLYAQKLRLDGNAAWQQNGVPVCTAPDSQKDPDIVGDDSGGAVVTWSDKGGGSYDIYAQILSPSGKPVLTVDGIPICQNPGTQRDPKISKDGAGGAIIVWEDFRNANWDIFAQRIDQGGNLLFREDGLAVCNAPLTQYSPRMVSGAWGAIIVWEDYRNGKNYNVYAQKVSPSGDFLWSENGIAICSGQDGERNPEIADNGGGGAVIAWEDYRAGGFGIYAQKVKVIKLM